MKFKIPETDGSGTKASALVLCEFSDTVGSALRAKGFHVLTNDLLRSEGEDHWHIKGDCFDAIDLVGKVDLIVMHPPCTALAVSGNSTYGRGMPKHQERLEAIEWTMALWDKAKAHADHVAMENPVNVLPVKATQFVQPYQFGHLEQKKTGFWLHNLPPLTETNNVYDDMMKLPKNKRERLHYLPPSEDRWRIRSTTFSGIASAIAEQWGRHVGESR